MIIQFEEMLTWHDFTMGKYKGKWYLAIKNNRAWYCVKKTFFKKRDYSHLYPSALEKIILPDHSFDIDALSKFDLVLLGHHFFELNSVSGSIRQASSDKDALDGVSFINDPNLPFIQWMSGLVYNYITYPDEKNLTEIFFGMNRFSVKGQYMDNSEKISITSLGVGETSKIYDREEFSKAIINLHFFPFGRFSHNSFLTGPILLDHHLVDFHLPKSLEQ